MTPSEAERDRLAEELGRHYVAGTLEADGLDVRLGQLYAGEAAAALDGLPPLPAASPAAPPKRRGLLRRRGHGESEAAQPGWRPTPERFVDPTTRRVMRVWVDPADGARHYVAEGS